MRETCAQEVGPGDGEEKRSEGTQNPDRRQREVELRDKAILQQKRRLKQATQFVHKDSADLLPLDGLKRLGTSKDLQPHSVVQRRLLEGNLNKLRGESREYTTWVQSPLYMKIHFKATFKFQWLALNPLVCLYSKTRLLVKCAYLCTSS
uniref:Nuclear receptor interacting protein 2 n=1 Tax=Terrapene triunguis TaxID=2587831 RepID=A0A674JN33_9SAUR